jgi:glyoxylate reductase
MKFKVFITRMIPDEGINLLKKQKNIDLDIYEHDKKIPRGVLKKRVKGADIILSILTEKMDAEIMDAAGPQLKMIANYAVGFNNIDLKAAAERGIIVTNAPNEQISESVAEHTVALMFALAKRIVEADTFTRAGKYKAWGPQLMLGTDLWGKTVGIIGAGHIGSAVVKRLHDGFNMNVIYHNPTKNKHLEKETGAKYRSMEQLLKEADFVSLHVPLLPSTKGMIGSKELKLMKKTAFLINTARGPVVKEKALTRALMKGEIAGAALDVFECEPLIDCDPNDNLELRKLNNVILTPHTASATLETRQAMSRVAASNIIAFTKGKQPPNQIQ